MEYNYEENTGVRLAAENTGKNSFENDTPEIQRPGVLYFFCKIDTIIFKISQSES